MKELWHKALVYFGFADEEEYEDSAEEEVYDNQYEESPTTVRKIDRPSEFDRFGRRERVATLHPLASRVQSRVHVVEPKSFNDVQRVADKFKADTPVIMNLQQVDATLSKRLIDFTSGLTYALEGGIQRVAEKVFLITPKNVEVSAEEKRRLQEKGFFNQF